VGTQKKLGGVAKGLNGGNFVNINAAGQKGPGNEESSRDKQKQEGGGGHHLTKKQPQKKGRGEVKDNLPKGWCMMGNSVKAARSNWKKTMKKRSTGQDALTREEFSPSSMGRRWKLG